MPHSSTIAHISFVFFFCIFKAITCASIQCLNGGTCKDEFNNSSCFCAKYSSGELCETLEAFYSEWSPYSNCSVNCGNGALKTRTRYCTDLAGNSRSECNGETYQQTVRFKKVNMVEDFNAGVHWRKAF